MCGGLAGGIAANVTTAIGRKHMRSAETVAAVRIAAGGPRRDASRSPSNRLRRQGRRRHLQRPSRGNSPSATTVVRIVRSSRGASSGHDRSIVVMAVAVVIATNGAVLRATGPGRNSDRGRPAARGRIPTRRSRRSAR